MEIIAFLVTIIIGFFSGSAFGNYMNWPDGGSVVAIAVMGAFILRAIRHPKDK